MNNKNRYAVDFHWRLKSLFSFPAPYESTIWLGVTNRYHELDIHLGPVVVTIWKLGEGDYWR